MREWRSETRACIIGSALLLSIFSLQNDASASSIQRQSGTHATRSGAQAPHKVAATRKSGVQYGAQYGVQYGRIGYTLGRSAGYVNTTRGRYAYSHASYRSWGGISCVPYARSVSGMQIPGNAWEWWYNAAGQYARGHQPEPGSVMAFRANGRMRMGHVAVVSEVINAREVLIDHANWAGTRGGVARGVSVVDVSEANDWSAVRVQLGNRADFGSVYPTYGFIYNRPDHGGQLVTAAVTPSPIPVMNPAPADLRPVAERSGWRAYEEVAQAPTSRTKHRHLDLRINPRHRAH